MKKRFSFSMFVLAAFVFVIAGCRDINNPIIDQWWSGDPGEYPFTQESFVVSFDSGGGRYVDSINGNSPSASPQQVWAHAYASVPGLVAKENNYFTGWYDTQTGGNEWDFANDPVEKNMTLYAQWKESDGYTVNFDINFPVAGFNADANLTYTPQPEKIAEGAFAAEPLQFGLKSGSPYVKTHVFIGWYKDTTYTSKWVFDTDKVDAANDLVDDKTANKTIKLYARWVDLEVDPAEVYTVTFVSDADKNNPPDQYVISGSTVIAPYVTYRIGYSFGGWYKDPDRTDDWVFATDTVTADITLYAKWAPVDPVDVIKDLDIVDFRYILFSGGASEFNGDAAPGNTTNLSQYEKDTNDEEIAKIAKELNEYPHYRVMIIGHANPVNEDPQSPALMTLSEGRAEAVKGKLEAELVRIASLYDYSLKTPIVVRWEGGKRAMRNPMLSRRVEIVVFDIITEEITP